MIRALIVDDESPARRELTRFLQQCEDFEIAGEATNGEEAFSLIQKLQPDVVFLDIQMPKKNGLETAERVARLANPPIVVFVTAYDQYAVKAFEVNAIDYLLKPYDAARFRKTCEKIRDEYDDKTIARKKLTSLAEYLEHEKKIQLTGHQRNSRDRVLIRVEDVLFFHAELTEISAHLKDGSELILNMTLKSLLDLLDPAQFQQTHKSYVVNLKEVLKVSPILNGNYEIALKDQKTLKIPLSRRYAQHFRQLLKW